jgi:Glycosyltransferase like family
MNWTVISITNNDEVLKSCLLSSPDIGSASEVLLQRGYTSAAIAYNRAIEKAQSDLLVLVHQDVYLPQGWLASLWQGLAVLSKVDPNWGILGVWGVAESSAEFTGFLYCAANGKLGGAFEGVREVRSLDEVVLIMRKSSKLRFDEQLPGFHMYGTDICLEARRQGMRSYAIPAFCIHNTSGYRMLPWQFWRCYFFMRRKWSAELPVTTSCTKITTWCWPMIRWNLTRAVNIVLGRHRVSTRLDDPSRLNSELVFSNAGVEPEPRR